VTRKFGLLRAERRADDEGVELSPEERKRDAVARLASAPPAARWVCAADALHSIGTILADLKRTEYPETVWSRTSRGRDGTIRYYRQLCDRLAGVGFDAPILTELLQAVEAVEQHGAPAFRG
jgi:hypothetical protein